MAVWPLINGDKRNFPSMITGRSEKTDPRKNKTDVGLILGVFASLIVLGALIWIVNWPIKIPSKETNNSAPSATKRAADTLPAPTRTNR